MDIKPNLEPVDEKDMDMEGKFKAEGKTSEGQKETIVAPEKKEAKEQISAEKDSAYNKILSKVKDQTQRTSSDLDIKSDAQEVAEKQDAESQISHLVDIAMTKGVVHAVKVARHMEDYYVLDMFHDRLLVDEFHDALIAKGLIKDI